MNMEQKQAVMATILKKAPVVPVMVIDDIAHAVPLARALVAGGLPVLEITLRTDVALEAMSAEVPVVCSNAGGLPEVVEHGFTGFLHDPAHVAGYTASVLKLLTNDTLRRTMGRRGRRVAMERFGAEEMVERYVRIYESLR